jgi:transposase
MSRTRYPTDLADAQWKRIEQLVPRPKPGGRPAKYTRREVVNAILYQARNGCVWRALPHDPPPYRIAFHYFRLWQADGTRGAIHDRPRADVRRAAGERPKPAAAIVDSQSVKATEVGGPRGADAGEKSRRPRAVRGG